jgi:hypothetical protein
MIDSKSESPQPNVDHESQTAALQRMARDIQDIKSNLLQVINYMHEAESEVPEKMRRFIMYFHDVHDLITLYHSIGQEPGPWILRETERCADRFRHLVEDLEKPGEAFEKVRREMSTRPGNRYDHTKLLATETKHETGNGEPQQSTTENGTPRPSGVAGSGE